MSEKSIWPLRKTRLGTWWQNPCWHSQRSDVSCSWATRFAHFSGGILSHSSLQILSMSLKFRGWRLATRTFSSLHRFSMGFRSGDWLGHSWTLMCFFLSHSFVALAVCFESLSCWKTHPWPIFNALAGFNALALMVHGPVHRPFDAVQLSCPLSRKTHPKHNVSTSMFDGGDGVLGVIGSIPVELMPKSLILVSSDHNTFTQFSSESLVNCGRCRISVLHGVVCYQLFSWWLWSQLPWDHWQDAPV